MEMIPEKWKMKMLDVEIYPYTWSLQKYWEYFPKLQEVRNFECGQRTKKEP